VSVRGGAVHVYVRCVCRQCACPNCLLSACACVYVMGVQIDVFIVIASLRFVLAPLSSPCVKTTIGSSTIKS